MAPHYTKLDDQRIADNFPIMGNEVATLFPDRTRESVLSRARRLGFNTANRRTKGDCWTEDEIKILRDNFTKMGSDVISMLPGRSRQSINNKAQMLHIPSPNSWSREEDRIIVKACYDYTNGTFEYSDTLPDLLPNRSENSIRLRVHNLAKHRTSVLGGYPINAYIAITGSHKGYDKIDHKFYDLMEAAFDAIKTNSNNRKVAEAIVKALELHYKLGMDIIDVAAELNVSNNTARWLLNTGLKFLKQALKK